MLNARFVSARSAISIFSLTIAIGSGSSSTFCQPVP